ncbi:AsnC family transcriptional regulator [Thermincola ferriacetica]|uniref:AsnC family transcriptional regulator n=1 Tax=Thermincola ferriacetica TaxID=281456 RepID=A0A0L6W4T0_9FIRM|nr:Rrf2 family transcriptional regulator [Thermincola ferriacetica]KNZ70104.1 AsnC family transcriptional regulator [Thermincola ferriacetica]
MSESASYIQKEIIRILKENRTSYANPMNSLAISRRLNATPSYIREQAKRLSDQGLLNVRRGPGGGYFIDSNGEDNS